MVQVKICGITRVEDGVRAVECGADMLGFNFYSASPRYLHPDDCRIIIERLNGFVNESQNQVTMVGVFVNHPIKQVLELVDFCGLHLAQLSGDEGWEYTEALGKYALKVIRSSPGESLLDIASILPLKKKPPAFLLDASVPGEYGGTGTVADWEQAASLAQSYPIMLAGGLTPDNVCDAVHQVMPWGVDVASGIESTPGKKDFQMMEKFIHNAKGQSTLEVKDAA